MKLKTIFFLISLIVITPTIGGAQENNEESMINYEDAIAPEDILAPGEIEREEEILYPPQVEGQDWNLENEDTPAEEY